MPLLNDHRGIVDTTDGSRKIGGSFEFGFCVLDGRTKTNELGYRDMIYIINKVEGNKQPIKI